VEIVFVSPQERELQQAGRDRVVSMETTGGGMDPLFPPGFRFYPTEEELLSFYLRHLLAGTRPNVERFVPVVDIYSYHPRDLQCTQ
jgi:hypothetical protein